jgi:fluoride ion exporter CrcB/FEX
MHAGTRPAMKLAIANLKVPILVLNIVGCLLLSILIATISLSKRLARRGPVVKNFLYTWVLLSALIAFEFVSRSLTHL